MEIEVLEQFFPNMGVDAVAKEDALGDNHAAAAGFMAADWPAEGMFRVQFKGTYFSGQYACILWPCQGQNGNPGLGLRCSECKSI